MPDENEEERSEFGKGYAYCLGLFLAHEMRIHEYIKANEQAGKTIMDASIWFNGAADHLFELTAPPQFSDADKRQVDGFRDRCIAYRLCMNGEKCTYEDARAACREAKAMLLEWDRINGIPAIKGDWE